MKNKLACAAAALLAAGCALDPQTASAPMEEKEYRTGTNLPSRSREGVHRGSAEDFERARAQSAGNIGKRPGMGN